MKLHDIICEETKLTADVIKTWVRQHVKDFIGVSLMTVVKDGKWHVSYGPGRSTTDVTIKIIDKESTKICEMDDEIVYQIVSLETPKIKNLKNLPTKQIGSLELLHCESLESFEGIPKEIKFLSILGKSKIDSLEGLSKHVTKVEEIMIRPLAIKTGLLECFKIPDLQYIDTARMDDKTSLKRACDIVTKNLKRGRPGIVKAQQELIENDLEDFA